MKKIVLTGGGTAGHVTPNIALFPALKEAGYEISYIGSYAGMEKQLIEEQNIPYYGISSGKLRRYKDLRNLTDPFKKNQTGRCLFERWIRFRSCRSRSETPPYSCYYS